MRVLEGPDPIFVGAARPHYFLKGTVFEAALNRVRWLFDEFDGHVSVSTSGGKDSTVVLELAAMVAAERGIPSIKAHFLDQEAEYEATIEYMRVIRDRPDVDLDWYQIPFRLFNATSHTTQWTQVWDPDLKEEDWIRPKEPDSIHENTFFKGKGKRRVQVDRFKEILHAMNNQDGGAILTGMRCEESPSRRIFMTSVPTYKWVTWASGKGEDFKLFHPIYDWSYRDVWRAIQENGWTYNTFYDDMFRYGVKLQAMRVSSFHHEQSYLALNYLQEVEPKTWEKAVQRVPGLNTYSHVGDALTQHYLWNTPHMFTSRVDYLDYLIENLVESDENRTMFRKMWANAEHVLPYVPRPEIAYQMLVMVMINDVYGSNMDAFIVSQKHPAAQRSWDAFKKNPKLYNPALEVGRAS